MTRRFLPLFLFVTCCVSAMAANRIRDDIKQFYTAIEAKPPGQRTTDELRKMLRDDPLRFTELVKYRLATGVVKPLGIEKLKDLIGTNLIGGAAGTSNGATSLVSNGIVPMILGSALEHGALTQSAQGTVATLRGNLYGIWKFAAGQDPYCEMNSCAKAVDFARRLSFAVGLDLSRTGTVAVTAENATNSQALDFRLASLRQQLDHATVRVDFRNERDVRSSQFQTKWNQELQDQNLLDKAKTLGETVNSVFQGKEQLVGAGLDALIKALQSDRARTAADMAVLIEESAQRTAVEVLQSDQAMEEKIRKMRLASREYEDLMSTAARNALTRFSYSFEYTYSRPKAQPTLSNLRFVATGSPAHTDTLMLSANFGVAFYNDKPAQFGAVRDVQASAQLDRKLGGRQLEGTLSGAFYYQWMVERALIRVGDDTVAPGTNIPLPGPASTLLAPPGNLWLGQVKLSLSFKGTGLKIPIAFSYASRTELIKATERRGNIGITYDFDHLFLPTRR